MQLPDVLQLSFRYLRQRKVRSGLIILGIAVGIGALVLLVSLSLGVRKGIVDQLPSAFGTNEIQITPKYQNALFVFQKKAEGGGVLDEATLDTIRKIPGVTRVSPQLVLSEPSTLYIEMFDQTFELDTPVIGIEPDVVTDDIKAPRTFTADTKPVPVLASPKLVDLYNLGFAEASGFPRINAEPFIGQKFTLRLGYAAFTGATSSQGTFDEPMQLVGFSNRVPIVGITLPLEKVIEYQRQFHPETIDHLVYSLARVIVEDPAQVPTVSAALDGLKFETYSLIEETKRVSDMMGYVTAVLVLVSLVILMVAALNIVNTLTTAVLERTREIGVLRAVGATKRHILVLFLTEASILGLSGGLIGVIGGLVLSRVLDQVILNMIPEASFKPVTLFSTPFWLILSVLALSVGISVLAGFIPARKAASLDPIEALRNE